MLVGLSRDGVRDGIAYKSAYASASPPDDGAQGMLAPRPVLPDEDGQDGGDARLEGAQEEAAHGERGEVFGGSLARCRDAPEGNHDAEISTKWELLHKERAGVLGQEVAKVEDGAGPAVLRAAQVL